MRSFLSSFSLFTVAAIGALAGCSTTSSERVGASESALAVSLLNLHVAATESTMSFSWSGIGAYEATLTGPGYSGTRAASAIGSTESVAFTGLEPCGSYSWSIASGGTVVQSGVTNTRHAGGGACPMSESMTASTLWYFEGLEHQEEQNVGCGNWSAPEWPVGHGWGLLRSTKGSYTNAQFGYVHFSNDSSFCAESTVRAYRTELDYHLSEAQWARTVINATLDATVSSSGNACTANGTPITAVGGLVLTTWPANVQAPEWWALLGDIPSNESDTLGIVADGVPSIPVVTSGTHFSVSFGAPQTPIVRAGFAANDGFANLSRGASQTWAADNDTCLASLRDVALTVAYRNPMPPETPINCMGAIACGGVATVTCNAAPDVFELHAHDVYEGDHVVAKVDATSGGMPTMTYAPGSSDETYSVCTLNGAGDRACAPVTITSLTACPPVPSSLFVSANPLWTGETSSGVVTLNIAAPAGGTTVSLTTIDPWGLDRPSGLTVPASVTVPAGQSSVTFPIGVGASTALNAVELIATANGAPATAIVDVFPGNVYLQFSYGANGDGPLTLGSTGSLSLWVRDPAPANGATVSLTGSIAGALTMPSSISLAGGTSSAVVTLTDATSIATSDVITATYEGSSSTIAVTTGPTVHTPPPHCTGQCI